MSTRQKTDDTQVLRCWLIYVKNNYGEAGLGASRLRVIMLGVYSFGETFTSMLDTDKTRFLFDNQRTLPSLKLGVVTRLAHIQSFFV